MRIGGLGTQAAAFRQYLAISSLPHLAVSSLPHAICLVNSSFERWLECDEAGRGQLHRGLGAARAGQRPPAGAAAGGVARAAAAGAGRAAGAAGLGPGRPGRPGRTERQGRGGTRNRSSEKF